MSSSIIHTVLRVLKLFSQRSVTVALSASQQKKQVTEHHSWLLKNKTRSKALSGHGKKIKLQIGKDRKRKYLKAI